MRGRIHASTCGCFFSTQHIQKAGLGDPLRGQLHRAQRQLDGPPGLELLAQALRGRAVETAEGEVERRLALPLTAAALVVERQQREVLAAPVLEHVEASDVAMGGGVHQRRPAPVVPRAAVRVRAQLEQDAQAVGVAPPAGGLGCREKTFLLVRTAVVDREDHVMVVHATSFFVWEPQATSQ